MLPSSWALGVSMVLVYKFIQLQYLPGKMNTHEYPELSRPVLYA